MEVRSTETFDPLSQKESILEALGDFGIKPPMGFQLLVQLIKDDEDNFGRLPDGTRSSIILPDQARENNELIKITGKVIAMGPACYKDEKRFKDWGGYFPKIGDYIVFPRHEGTRVDYKSHDIFYLIDEKILGLVDDPSSVKRA